MRRTFLRTVLMLATLAVVWLIVSPASAMAPICDPRGAIGFAPPPQIQDEERSIDIPADCFDVNPFEARHVVPGHSGKIDFSASQEPVAPTRQVLPNVMFTERLPVSTYVEPQPSWGVRTSVERPPRS